MKASRLQPVSIILIILCLAVPSARIIQPVQAASPITFTILHTNDFHGQLESSANNPGMARTAAVINGVRTAVGAANVLLVDGGDEMQGSLLSNLKKGQPTIAIFKSMGYNVATFGNHEFDWGQQILNERMGEATATDYVTANIVQGACDDSNWSLPSFAEAPYVVKTLPSGVKVAFIGVTTTEVPTITIASATEGLCFKDPTESILHYYAAMKAEADIIVVLSHLGYTDGGYGYGIPVYGDESLARNLINAGAPVNLIIGGHSHTQLSAATSISVAGKPGEITVVQAYYNGRAVGRADFSVDPDTHAITITWSKLAVSTSGTQDSTINTQITTYTSDPAYVSLVQEPIGYTAIDLARGNGDNMMGTFIDDAIYYSLNSDDDPSNDVDVIFNNAGGIRADICDSACDANLRAATMVTYGNMYSVLPFGNQTVVGKMTGAQILEVLNQAPLVSNGIIQPAGLRYKYFAYSDANPGPQPYAWGAFDACVVNKGTGICDPLEIDKVYSVGTNEFLAPAGGDSYGAFKYMTDITYWGDMLNTVNAYVSATYDTPETAYQGPNGDGTLDERIIRDGTDATGSIIPLTILHNNDSHGNLSKTGASIGYTQLATLIQQERAHNPTRTLLLNGGDQIQGDKLSHYYQTAPSGFAVDGEALPVDLQIQPTIAVMNALDYDAMVLGNHDFNFGHTVFTGVFGQATFPILGANVVDDGRYGLAQVGTGNEGVQPYTELTVGTEGIKVGILGLTNHHVPNYELPSNIVGLTFSNPFTTAQQYATELNARNEVVIALTHLGFTTNPDNPEVDSLVDTNLAAQVAGLDAILGAHSHTKPTIGEAAYKYLPSIVDGLDHTPVLINQAYRNNAFLGKIILGMKATGDGGYEVVSRTGQNLAVSLTTAEDPTIKAIVDPYVTLFATFSNSTVGKTTVPIDSWEAFTQETNSANLQADAAVWELTQNGIPEVDFYLGGAMVNHKIASTATAANPFELKVSDLFTMMPYDNTLVVLRMNGPQIRTILERAYRNYYYYKYFPGNTDYARATACMLDIDSSGQITYNDLYPNGYAPQVNHVASLVVNGVAVDLTNTTTYYNVATTNYLASGGCNYTDNTVSLWPLGQIVNDTQISLRDALIDYIAAAGTVSPAVEDRLIFLDIQSVYLPVLTNH
ncbi:MAG TPA: 5'-nucleotidase C-terminal domain-containing protein [Anaerolineaceae bacterium]|nr:5'-nucleotidase C-terminal domain-containing protein [Anaerolineaceae bacterium]